MKKFVLLAVLFAIMLPAVAQAQYPSYDPSPGIKQGDPMFYFAFPGGTIEMVVGETWYFESLCANYYPEDICSPNLDDFGNPSNYLDTFAIITTDIQGWDLENYWWPSYDLASDCYIWNLYDSIYDASGDSMMVNDHPNWYWWNDLYVTVPCDQGDLTDQLNTVTMTVAYCDGSLTAQPDSGDCTDPNYRSGGTIACYSTMTQNFKVIAPELPLVILQDTLYYVEEGVTSAYIPFSLCNGDLCAGTGDYDYIITSLGNVGPALNQTGTVADVSPGDCEDVYGLVDAGSALACTWDTLTIIAWDAGIGSVYDTCVQAIHVIEPVPVPLFTAPVVTILVLAMILAAAVIMKRHAVSKA